MFIFDGPNLKIYIEPSAVAGDVVMFTPQQLWSSWIDWIAEGDNSKYPLAFESVMIPLDGSTLLGQYLFLRNDLGWRGVPPTADHVSIVINGSFYAKDSMLPIMENVPNQETDLVINRSTLTTTMAINSTGSDLSEVLTRLTQLENKINKTATKGDIWASAVLGVS